MIDALGEWMSQPAYFSALRRRAAAAHRGPASVHLAVRAVRDAPTARSSSGSRTTGSGGALCRDVLRRPDLATDPRFATNTDRVAHNAELTAIIEAAFADADRRRGRRRGSTRPESPTPGCARPRSSTGTRSCGPRPLAAGPHAGRAMSTRCCRRSRSAGQEPVDGTGSRARRAHRRRSARSSRAPDATGRHERCRSVSDVVERTELLLPGARRGAGRAARRARP